LRILAVDNLNIEDMQRALERNNPLLVDANQDQTNFRYYPNVGNDVYRTFSLIPRSNNMKCSHIHFELTSSRIYETLDDALNIMQTTIDSIGTNTNNAVVIALINAPVDDKKSSRERRQTNGNEVLISDDKTCMFYAEKLYWNDVNGTKSGGRVYNINLNASSCKENKDSSGNYSSVILNLILNNANTPFDTVSMSLNTTIIGGYWYLINATLNNNEYRYFAYGMHSRMDTPPKFSYVCTTAIFVRFDNLIKHGKYNFSDKFYLTKLQFQPFHGNGLSFGLPNYCTSFFTSGIWMGITSSLLCLIILLFAIHRMMTIKSNDRFDDPKGKPLFIKTQE